MPYSIERADISKILIALLMASIFFLFKVGIPEVVKLKDLLTFLAAFAASLGLVELGIKKLL